jgi:hypothetical protein
MHFVLNFIFMKNISICFVFCCTLLLPVVGFSQGVGINSQGAPPHSSAGLDVSFTDKGLLPPRLTTAQRDLIVSPAIGLQVFNTTTSCLEVYFANGWKPAVCECTQAPAAPAGIIGSTGFCANDTGVVYQVAAVPDAGSYVWTLPPGASIVSGSGTNSIVVNFGSTGGSITVQAVNGCGSSSVTQQALNLIVPSATFTHPQAAVGVGTTFTHTGVGSNLQWTFQGGSPASSTSTNPSVTWNSTGSYLVTLIASESATCADTVTMSVPVINCPPGSQDFTYTGSVQTFTVPACVSQVTIEAWGAQGGTGVVSHWGVGGNGGYSIGTATVTPGSTLYVYVGQQGFQSATLVAFNGGGSGNLNTSSQGNGYTGGGASHVATVSGTLNSLSGNIPSVLIVAGGGGGCAGATSTNWPQYAANGGAGGGLNGIAGPSSGGESYRPGGGGGSQTAGGISENPSVAAGFGRGASSSSNTGDAIQGGGGGGGFYGGGAGGHAGGAGGGGSSYIAPLSNAQTVAGNATMPNPSGGTMTGKTGNGFVRITW